jgi:hypothetical protein
MIRRCLLILTLPLVLACQDPGQGDRVALRRNVLERDFLYRYFNQVHGGKVVVAWAFADVDNDGRHDLILIYRVGAEKNSMRVVLSAGGTYAITNDVPAPVSNQTITFKDIDERPPLEFIVQGMKGAKIGYAVYRIEKGRLVDLFGEGMEGCC